MKEYKIKLIKQMAGRIYSEDEFDIIKFDSYKEVEVLIYRTFEKIITTAVARRDRLVRELNEMKLEYLRKEETRIKQNTELERDLRDLRRRDTRVCGERDFINEEIIRVKAEIKISKTPTIFPVPQLCTESFQILLQQLEGFAYVRGTAGPYNDKVVPYRISGGRGRGRGEFNDPKGIVLDENQQIFVADFLNQRVQVLSKEGKFVAEFGNSYLFRPYGIAIYRNWVFVSDKQFGIVFKFLLTNYKMVSKSGKGKLASPSGLTVDEDGEVLVADCGNNRIAVLNSELKPIREIGKGTLTSPQDIKIQINRLFVVDNNTKRNLHIFSKQGELLKSIIKLENGSRNIFFCFDLYNSILVSDFAANSIKLFTMDGKLIHRIQSTASPTGIAVTDNFNVINARFYLYSCDVRFY